MAAALAGVGDSPSSRASPPKSSILDGFFGCLGVAMAAAGDNLVVAAPVP